MNWYEEKQEARKQRLLKRAQKTAEEGAARIERGRKALSAIEFGQPILVGHYSEKGDRAYRNRATGNISKGIELSVKADRIQERADAVGTGGISSDDPNAIEKLEKKLLDLQEAHALMIERNKEARSLGQQSPYASFQLTNNSANIRRIQKRIKELEAKNTAMPVEPVIGSWWTMCEDIEENRVMFTFTAIPSEELRKTIKSWGFKWSPSRKAWVRMLNNAARFAAIRVIEELNSGRV